MDREEAEAEDVWRKDKITLGEALRAAMDGDRVLHGNPTRSLRRRTLRHHEGHPSSGLTTMQWTELHDPHRLADGRLKDPARCPKTVTGHGGGNDWANRHNK